MRVGGARALGLQASRRGLRIAAVQLNVTPDPLDNLKRAAQGISIAASEGASIIALPECFVGSYGVQHFEKWAEKLGEFGGSAMMSAAAKDSGVTVVGGVIEVDEEAKCMYNTVVAYGPDGAIASKYRKVHLSRVLGITSESDVLAPGDEPVAFECESLSVGLACCYDLRFPKLLNAYGPAKSATHGPIDLLIAPSAFLATTGKDHWDLLVRRAALDGQCFVLAPNQAFNPNDPVPLYGGSLVAGPWGDVLSVCVDRADGIAMAEISHERIEEVRSKLPIVEAARWPPPASE